MRVLLVDDHSLFLESLENLLTANGFQVVGTAGDGLMALEQARRLRPDLILMDVAMPRCDGLAATRLIKAEMPALRIVMLTASEHDELLFEAIKSGATGYLLKSLRAPEFIQQLNQIDRGEPPLSPGLALKIMQALAKQPGNGDTAPAPAAHGEIPAGERLSARQSEVLTLVAHGLSYAEVAETLHVTEKTVNYHMGEIFSRLHLHSRAEVMAYLARMGLKRPPG